ncbi:hypothetical protein J2S49_000729 [Arcanobacterium wilhelmae]|uniref:Uncharacterized protein n=1 Tax=Arcanobacterium wilhelmae TaxID=1803177 RepID=A0ABT9NAD7_9ACTO|nr:hypothetical protein [Arcanobacterium wilhelmae]MDP9800653.1 hypothetical protein [Arcanobacterium wilhelmae]WFN90056.1 hypothetical protein P8A24_07630 [Arcanobacterium wilhelmae]
MSETEKNSLIDLHPGYTRGVAGVLGAGVLAVAGVTSSSIMALGVLALALPLVAGWPHLMGLPNKAAAYPVLALTLLGTIGAGLFGDIRALAVAAAAGMMGVFVMEMARRDSGGKRVEQISGALLGVVMLVSASTWIRVAAGTMGKDIVTTVAATLAVVALMHAFDSQYSPLLGSVNGVVVATAMAWLMNLPLLAGVVLGAAVGGAYFLTWRAVENLPRPSGYLAGAARAFIPHSALGVVAFAIALILF